MFPVTAVDTKKYLSLAGQRIDAPAFITGLGTVGGPYFSKLPAFPSKLVSQELSQKTPSLVEDTSREPSICLHHVTDSEIFDHDDTVALSVVVTELMAEMFSLPPDLPVKIGNTKFCFLPVL